MEPGTAAAPVAAEPYAHENNNSRLVEPTAELPPEEAEASDPELEETNAVILASAAQALAAVTMLFLQHSGGT
jgi:hypothetical protein